MKDGKISRLFCFLNTLPWTKPLAILTWGVNMLVFVGAWLLSKDIPPISRRTRRSSAYISAESCSLRRRGSRGTKQ